MSTKEKTECVHGLGRWVVLCCLLVRTLGKLQDLPEPSFFMYKMGKIMVPLHMFIVESSLGQVPST